MGHAINIPNFLPSANITDYQSIVNITNNDIYDNIEYNIKMSRRNQTTLDITAASNLWGTTDYNAISQSIYDSINDQSLGKVTFTPFFTAPYALSSTNANGPSHNSNNTPVIVAITVVVLIFVIAVVVVVKRKNQNST